jgi:hypothetical protein
MGIEGQANDLVDEPFFVLGDQKLAQLILELRDEILVDLPNHGFDGGHSDTSLAIKNI